MKALNLSLSEIRSFLEKKYGKTALKKGVYFDMDMYWERYNIEIPLNEDRIIIVEIIGIDENNLQNFKGWKDSLATKVQDQDKEGLHLALSKEVDLSTNWKDNLLKAIHTVQSEVALKSKEKVNADKLLKDLRSTPMFNFDPFLKSLEKYLLAHDTLTPAQQQAFNKVKWRYTPRIALNKKQIDFLKAMNTLPTNEMDTNEIETISKMYAKACAGTTWNDNERNEVAFIMKKYIAL